jgi:putative addiction module component (TIGR02574 family)
VHSVKAGARPEEWNPGLRSSIYGGCFSKAERVYRFWREHGTGSFAVHLDLAPLLSTRLIYTETMTRAEIQREVMELPEEDRLEIAEAIWSSLDNPNALSLPQWQKDLLDERLASAETEEGRDWEDVKAEIWPLR